MWILRMAIEIEAEEGRHWCPGYSFTKVPYPSTKYSGGALNSRTKPILQLEEGRPHLRSDPCDGQNVSISTWPIRSTAVYLGDGDISWMNEGNINSYENSCGRPRLLRQPISQSNGERNSHLCSACYFKSGFLSRRYRPQRHGAKGTNTGDARIRISMRSTSNATLERPDLKNPAIKCIVRSRSLESLLP